MFLCWYIGTSCLESMILSIYSISCRKHITILPHLLPTSCWWWFMHQSICYIVKYSNLQKKLLQHKLACNHDVHHKFQNSYHNRYLVEEWIKQFG